MLVWQAKLEAGKRQKWNAILVTSFFKGKLGESVFSVLARGSGSPLSQVNCELLGVSLAQGSVTLEAMVSLILYNERNIHVHILRAPYAGENIRVWWFVEMSQMGEWGSGIECVTPSVNLNVNSALWMIRMCLVSSSIVTNVPLWWKMLIMEKAVSAWGQRVYVSQTLCTFCSILLNLNLKLL